MRDVALRPVTPNDGEFTYQVKKAAFKQYVEPVFGWNEDDQRQHHMQRFSSETFRIIAEHRVDVGFVATCIEPDCLRVKQLFVLPEHQGRGIGRACIMRVIDEARRLGLPVRLRVMKNNPRAKAFYERLGFSCTGDTETHFLMEGSF